MSQSQAKSAPLPRWVAGVASVAIAFHLVAVGALALGAYSGPWVTEFGSSTARGPEFARVFAKVLRPTYFKILNMPHDYHFASDGPEVQGVFLEARLKNERGETVRTINIPEEGENFWVRHRESLLVLSVADDVPVQAPRGEVIPGEGEQVRKVAIWDSLEGDTVARLRTVPEHLIPRQRPVYRPSEASLLRARSFARYLCRTYGVAKVELLRHSRNAIQPANVLRGEPIPGTFEELICSFGDLQP
jgi:hypothetical protein